MRGKSWIFPLHRRTEFAQTQNPCTIQRQFVQVNIIILTLQRGNDTNDESIKTNFDLLFDTRTDIAAKRRNKSSNTYETIM